MLCPDAGRKLCQRPDKVPQSKRSTGAGASCVSCPPAGASLLGGDEPSPMSKSCGVEVAGPAVASLMSNRAARGAGEGDAVRGEFTADVICRRRSRRGRRRRRHRRRGHAS